MFPTTDCQTPTEIDIDEFENDLLNKYQEENEKSIMKDAYNKDEKTGKYVLIIEKDNIEELTKIREILLKYNKDNELYTGITEHGAPSPHKFPRVFEAKSKAHFDIHFVWGVRFDSDVTLGFSVNLTNFIMPSLEIMVKYNFDIPDYPFEPYVGGVLYGGFMDGFPIGINVIGGCDVFPMFYEDRLDNKNFYLSGELRMGAVIYTPIYFDTGENSEGIWKKLSLLAEGGFYFGYGYIWNYDINRDM